MLVCAALLLVLSTIGCGSGSVAAQPGGGVSAEALSLRNLGLAQLENEKPREAVLTFRRVIQAADSDPLGYANLAIAMLRIQEVESAAGVVRLALERAPGRPDLLAIQAEIESWQGNTDQAVALLRRAAETASPQILYALIRQADNSGSAEAEEALAWADERLARLRPENLVVLLRQGQRAIEQGDRELATRAFVRIRELLFQAPAMARPELDKVLAALEANEIANARVPGLRLGNLMRSTPIYKSSLVELMVGIQGMPVERFVGEPEPTAFGEGIDVTFALRPLAGAMSPGVNVVAGDWNGDQRPDLAQLVLAGEGENKESRLEIRLSTLAQGESAQEETALADAFAVTTTHPAGTLDRLFVSDLDNDGQLDLLAHGGNPRSSVVPLRAFSGRADGSFENATESFALQSVSAIAIDAVDYDSEGDLDLAIVRAGAGLELLRNNRETPFESTETLEAIGELALPEDRFPSAEAVVASDLDRDGDPDLVVGHGGGVAWLDNLRQGRFRDRSASAGLDVAPAAKHIQSVDLDNDGLPELVIGGDGVTVLANRDGVFGAYQPAPEIRGSIVAVLAFDADNDGRLDLAVVRDPQEARPEGESNLVVLVQRANRWQPLAMGDEMARKLGGVASVDAEDLDRDGDLDLAVATDRGLFLLENEGGNANQWLRITLRGLNQGSDKNNYFGRGASIEVRSGRAHEYREVKDPVTHFGLGQGKRADNVRVVWNNGVPQHRIHPETETLIVEEQVLKGSCPYLYTWNGQEIEFVTDLLWGAPLGMPVAPGAWASSDPEELVRIDGAAPRDGFYDLRITEELWEAAYFDRVRVWVVDHPIDTEAASSLRIFAGPAPDGGLDDVVRLSADLQPVAQAWDGQGRDVTQRVAARDDVYADGYPVGGYQGIAARPWAFTFDLGQGAIALSDSIRLVLDGWIFPADASLNLASAQRRDLDFTFTRLEVENPPDSGRWQTLLDPMGFPAGKTKTMVIDLPPLHDKAHRLRIVTSRWLHWDRLAWSSQPRDAEARVVAKLAPSSANLRYRGFSELVRAAPNAPHGFVYDNVTTNSPWLPLSGSYTRYGEVGELLTEADDRLVILGAGDEMALLFDARSLEPVADGFRRTLFLESLGWDKDADRNTFEADRVEPLPFRAMSGYPYPEPYPDTPELERYRRQYLTRVIEPELRKNLEPANTSETSSPTSTDL